MFKPLEQVLVSPPVRVIQGSSVQTLLGHQQLQLPHQTPIGLSSVSLKGSISPSTSHLNFSVKLKVWE